MICLKLIFSSRRRHTRLVSDWSSDVCSSDLQPIVADGVVYFGSKDGYFFAVNAATGELKWKTRTEGKFSYVQTSCISGNTVYFTTWNKGVLYACNKDN